MREIKFRAWSKEQERFGYVDLSSSDFGDPGWFDEELMQYTGLKDNNGKEVYENDILKAPDGQIYQMVWKADEYRFSLWDMDRTPDDAELKPIPYVKCEIIGNIYENPELMEDGDE